jgi:mono/diheme cytochrome c family protein
MRRVIVVILIAGSGAAGARAGDPVDYSRDIRPILSKRCFACHGPEKRRAGLRLDGMSFLHQGGDRGPAIITGAASESLLVKAVVGDDPDVTAMPPKGERLTPEEVSLIRAWIDQGTHGPTAETRTQPKAQASDHWAFRSVVRPPLPLVRDVSWVRNPIDHLILARLQRQGIRPAPEADRATLLRRLSLDLTGLPPTLADVDGFLADERPGAYERCVERLLASPSYGERWGRHWLDAASYADSGGSESDLPRSMGKYREWIIDALNRDLSFDRFVVEQLAGDLLPGATVEQTIATGFLCTAMSDGTLENEHVRLQMAVDRVNLIGTVFLGLTLGCAQCHSHKFDPISQREYYQFFAFFNNIDDARQEWELASPEEIARRDAVRAQVAALEQERKTYESTTAAREAAWEANLDAAARARLAPELRAALGIAPARRTEPQKLGLRTVFLAQDPGYQHRWETIKSLRDREPKFLKTHVARELAEPRTTHVFRRGEFSQPGDPVLPGVPAVLPSRSGPDPKSRLDLARWLVEPNHPLTARVFVNRVWEHYFGMGLVSTEDNFGLSGEPPSQPELLDWLASEFIARGWSLKALHRLIIGSATYRQSSHVRPELAGVDPSNRLLARQSRLRLVAEAIRDSALSVSGLLSRKIGGPSVFPFQPEGIMEGRADQGVWVESAGADRYRRGMYTHFWRLTPNPFLRLFDAPDATAACTRRIRSNTPLQALTLLNDPTFTECARALANRLWNDVPEGGRERARHAFRLCLGREPMRDELRKVEHYLHDQRRDAARVDSPQGSVGDAQPTKNLEAPSRTPSEWVGFARALLNLDEFITRE